MKAQKMLIGLSILFFAATGYCGIYQKANSDTKPQDIIQCKEKAMINYNIKEVEITDTNGKVRTVWEYDYVVVDGIATKAKVKEALRLKDIKEKDTEAWTPEETVAEYEQEKLVNIQVIEGIK